MKQNEKRICIFDIRNTQEDYARCLEFIKITETKELEKESKENRLTDLAESMKITTGKMNKGGAYQYIEKPMSVPNSTQEPESVYRRCVREGNSICDLLEERSERHYHLRVHFANSSDGKKDIKAELIQLQFLALLLRYFEDYNFIRGKVHRDITVFFVPETGEEYPYIGKNNEFDSDTYDLASQYLRVLTKKYNGVIYGAIKERGEVAVNALEFRQGNRFETYFPLIIIDGNRYERLFNESITEMELASLFSMNERSRFRESRNENPDIAVYDIAMETAIKHLLVEVKGKTNSPQECKSKMQQIHEMIDEQSNISIIQLALFAFMFSYDEGGANHVASKVEENLWKLATEVSIGLQQIVQNSVQHSAMKGCMFSFCLHENMKEETLVDFSVRLQRQYPNTEFYKDERTGKIRALEVFVSDLNDKEDMIESFCRILEDEQNVYREEMRGQSELIGHRMITNSINKLAVRNLFSEYQDGDLIEAWKAFRSQDMIAHVGLSVFKLVARRCKASVKVASSKSYRLFDDSRSFYMSNASHRTEKKGNDTGRLVVPGTQFSIIIPIHEIEKEREKGIGQLENKRNIVENYKTFAKFVDYIEKPILLTEGVKGEYKVDDIFSMPLQITNPKDKYRLVAKWAELWKARIGGGIETGKLVYCHNFETPYNMEYFNNLDNVEVCIKGLIEALDIVKSYNENIYLAFTRLPKGFVECFRKISALLGIRDFPGNLQMFLCEEDINNRLVFVGKNFREAIYNSYILSLEQGTNGFSREEYRQADALFQELSQNKINNEDARIEVGIFPFDAIIKYSRQENATIFEEGIKRVAEQPLDSDSIGYKLENTHMRLGSKVHIRAFYEMSFLFYRTTIANRIAFIILQKLRKDMENGEIDLDLRNDAVIFFGYASYSKAILTSVTEILRFYRDEESGKKECENVAFASYQHNLQTESEEIQMHFTIPKGFPGQMSEENKLKLSESVKKVYVIQLVPISSTLTTFDKMWNKFLGAIHNESINKIQMTENYTVFWVVSEAGDLREGKPSKIEERYWEKVNGNKIETKLKTLKDAGRAEVSFFIRNAVIWEDPLECELCYPEHVLEEIPLVETDQTSTVPAQQIRFQKGEKDTLKCQRENNERILALKECVYYGHIYRRQNHYQYYIDTQKFFNTVKEDVKKWLEKQNGSMLNNGREPVLNIIFSPEHNTNVGFAQYVNTYYFGGLAEIVSFNVDKEFRSNFICEHAALLKMIEKLYYDNIGNSMDFVRFYFVDDTIISGETFEKANSFIHSLIPNELKIQCPANLFKKVFLLVDRLSNETKSTYVEKVEDNFLSFVHIDVSNVRTQGDSCIGCKLEQNANRLRKRSATRNHSKYWTEKSKDYQKRAYDDRKEMDMIDKDASFQRLLISHVLQNLIIKNGNAGCVGAAYDILLDVCDWLLLDKGSAHNSIEHFETLLKEVRGIEGVKTLLKIIGRPFFSFDSKLRMQVQTLYIFMAELLMGEMEVDQLLKKEDESSKKFLYKENRISRTYNLVEKIREKLSEQEIVEFLRMYILEGIADVGSTYLMRLHTIKLAYQYTLKAEIHSENVKAFWESYIINLQRLVDNNSDETKELWLEYLYLNGTEYDVNEVAEKNQCPIERRLYKIIVGQESANKKELEKQKIFLWFCDEIFLQNTGIYFDGLKKWTDSNENDVPHDNDMYFMESWKRMRQLSNFKALNCVEENASERDKYSVELDFYKKITPKYSLDDRKDDATINGWYKDFLDLIDKLITERYPVSNEGVNIALVTENIDKDDFGEKIQALDIIKEKIHCKERSASEIRYELKYRIMKALDDEQDNQRLEENGYYVADGKGNDTYIIISFDNTNAVKPLGNVEHVFLYLGIKSKADDLDVNNMAYYILRDILTYRNRILEILERDFTGEIFAKYAHTVGEKNIVSHEKATSHNTTADDEITVELFLRPELINQYEALEELEIAKWLLLRNYTNGQIAKIFNRSFRENEEKVDEGKEIPPLYVKESVESDSYVMFKQKLETFGDLQILEGDKRFELLREIMTFKCDLSPDARLVQNSEGYSFNLEYFKCIILDICFSGIKYMSDGDDYLIRVDQFLSRKRRPELHKAGSNRIDCEMHIYREPSNKGGLDYLVLRNPVDKTYHELVDWQKHNEIIQKRLSDPLDFADGHMSLYAINRYIEEFLKDFENFKEPKIKCEFKYDLPRIEFGETARLYFETRLPVLKEEKNE